MSPIFDDGLYLMGATQSEQGLAFGNPLLEEVSIPFPQSRTVFSKFSAETGDLIWSTYAPESADCGSFRSMTILDSRIHILGTFGQFENYPDCFEFTPDAFQSAFGGGATDFGIFHYQENFLSTSFPNAEPLAIYPNPAQDYVTVEVPNLLWAGMNLTVIDLSGRVLDHMARFQSGSTYSIAHLSEGVYILSGRIGERLFRQKLVVHR